MAEKRVDPLARCLRAFRARAGHCFALAAVALACKSWGQPIAQPNVQSLDRQQAEQERLKKMLQGVPKAYVDKVMVPGDLPSTASDGTPEPEDLGGFRSYYSETRAVLTQTSDGLTLRSTRELGQRVGYFHETVNYGSFDLQADLRTSSGAMGLTPGSTFLSDGSGGRVTLRSIGFPITAQWFADTSVGDIQTEITNGLSRAYRISLGSRSVRGASTHVYSGGVEFSAGLGNRGNMAGGPYAGYERLPGSVGWLGGTWRPGGGWSYGLQYDRATAVSANSGFMVLPGITENIDSLAASVGFAGTGSNGSAAKWRLILVQNSTDLASASASDRTAHGVFAEGAYDYAGLHQEFGAFQVQGRLRFGDSFVASDTTGAYWRADGSMMRMNWGLGVQVEQSDPRQGAGIPNRRFGLQANGEYRLNRRESFGASFTVDRTLFSADPSIGQQPSNGASAAYATAYYQIQSARQGRTKIRLTVRHNQQQYANVPAATGEELEWEQQWGAAGQGSFTPEWSTTLGMARDRNGNLTQLSPTAGVSVRVTPADDWSVSGSLRYSSRRSTLSTSHGLSGSIDVERVLAPGWRAGAQLNLNQSVVDVSATSSLNGLPYLVRSNDRSASIFLRWDGAAGATPAGAGVRQSGNAGAGALTGVVFFDENRDDDQQVGENGVANVEVLLDGRFRTITDRMGRFSFPLVATGPHRITLQLDSIPLPWGINREGGWSADVPLRGQATVRVPVVRIAD